MNYIQLTADDMNLERRLLTNYKRNADFSLPDMQLVMQQRGAMPRYYRPSPRTGRLEYIRQSEMSAVFALQQKHYCMKAITVLEKNLAAQEKLIKHYSPYDAESLTNLIPKAYRPSPNIIDALEGASIAACSDTAMDESYQINHKGFRTKALIHKTSFGLNVRSKSEVTIAEVLHSYNIPFVYEKTLELSDASGGRCIRVPDFYFEPPSADFVILEHFGMLQNPEYYADFCEKIKIYHYNNITAPGRLLVTMDGPDGSLDLSAVDSLIRGQLLPLFR